MHFEDLVRLRMESFGTALVRRRSTLPILLQAHADLERSLAMGLSPYMISKAVSHMACAAALFATVGDERTLYEPQGDLDKFFSTLDDEIDITLPFVQIAYATAELHYSLFVPGLVSPLAWNRSQVLYLLCEHQYLTLTKEHPSGLS